jgi:multiple antibiotic resistance protein
MSACCRLVSWLGAYRHDPGDGNAVIVGPKVPECRREAGHGHFLLARLSWAAVDRDIPIWSTRSDRRPPVSVRKESVVTAASAVNAFAISSSTFLFVFWALFPVVNPPGSALVFLTMTRRLNHRNRSELATRIGIFSFLIIIASLLVGAYVLAFFGISVAVLRVAGGMVVAAAGWKLMNAPADSRSSEVDTDTDLNAKGIMRQAFYPLTMPLTTGPGTIATAIALGTTNPEVGHGGAIWNVLGGAAAAASLAILVFVCYRWSDRIAKLLGEGGTDALVRLTAFILLCIGMQILWIGLSDLLSSLPQFQAN